MVNKRILFVIKGGEEWMGGLHYIKNLVRTVHDHSPPAFGRIQIFLLVYAAEHLELFRDQIDLLEEIFVYDDYVKQTGLLQRMQWKIRTVSGNVLNAPLDQLMLDHRIDFVYPALPRKDFSKYRFADWIPDFQYRYFPEGSNKEEIRGRQEEFGKITKFAPLVYVSSEHAKKDCEELFPAARGKLHVMPFTVNTGHLNFSVSLEALLSKYHINRRYFIVSNLLAPTKNLQVVIKAVSFLKRQGINVQVVVTGNLHDYRNPSFKHQIFQLVNSEDVREQFVFLGLISRSEQKQLLVNSLAILQPSRFEGWNTLVEEAKSINKRIILSDIPVHLEQAPANGIFFKDNDAADLATVMGKQIQNIDIPEISEVRESEEYRQNIKAFAKHFLQVSFGFHTEA
jgi:glycosyltransferase involved in cell wall biosynthesis